MYEHISVSIFLHELLTTISYVTKVEQLHKIYKLCGSPSEEYWKKSKLPNATLFKPREPYKRCIRETFKDFPQSSLPLIDTLLAIDPAERKTATDALQSEVSSFSVSRVFVILSCLGSPLTNRYLLLIEIYSMPFVMLMSWHH